MRLLVFDDDAAIGRMVVKVAALAGMEATAVAEAEGFRRSLQQTPPQVIVLDLQLGDTDGIEQLQLLADQNFSGAVVLMSGFDSRVLGTARALGTSLGLKIDRGLQKPLQLAELEQTFARLLSADTSPTADQIREAIASDEMGLDFQPVVTRDPKRLVKLEALVRWEHPAAGRIPPGVFAPVAEGDPATIGALTEWVMRAAVEGYQILKELGVTVPIAVNMSTQNLRDKKWPNRIQQLLQAADMPPEHLCIEITESSAFDDPARTMEVLSRLRLKGINLAIDDFGTGYSSLKVLRQMPFSEIKIDQSFIADLTISRDSQAIVKSIADLASNMEMACVAEGIETEATAAMLEKLGVHTLQGFLIARPMPVESVAAWLAIWTKSALPRRPEDSGAVEEPPGLEESRKPASRRGPSPSTGSEQVQLPPRQLEVLQLAAEGCSVKQIARRLNIGVGTVKVHLSLAYSALGVHNRIDAIRRAGPAVLNRMHPSLAE